MSASYSSRNGEGAARAPRALAVIGGGAWGVALAAAAARAEADVVIQTRRDLAGSLPKGVRIVRTPKESAAHARLILLAVPSSACRAVARDLGDHLDGSHYVVHGVRGLEGDDLQTIADVIRDETPARRTGVGSPGTELEFAL